MKKIWKKMLSFAIAALLGVSAFGGSALADSSARVGTDGSEAEIELDVSQGKTAENLDTNYESKITLELPAAGYPRTIDVVFVVDCTSVLENYAGRMIAQLKSMAQELVEKDNLKLNVGLIGFGNTPKTFLELTELNASNMDSILSGLEETLLSAETVSWIMGNSGTNIQSAVKMGNAMLTNSTSDALDTNRYMVLMTDGAAFWYENENGEPASTAHNGDIVQALGNMDANNDVGGSARKNDSMYIRAKAEGKTFGDFISEQGAAIEESAKYSYSKADFANPDMKAEIKEHAYTTAEVQDFEAYPYINMERGTYYAAKALMDVRNNGYQVITIGYSYTAGLFNKSLREVSNGFKDWTKTIGSYYNGSNSESGMSNVFAGIKNEMVQLLDAGSYVIDEMGFGVDNYGNDYDFQFVNDIHKLSLTKAGVNLDKETMQTQNENETACYGFGKDSSLQEGYSFVLHYYENGLDGASNECVVWDINVPVQKGNSVKLTYSVKLGNPQTAEGVYGQYDADGSKGYAGLYTNNQAILYPVDSNGVMGEPRTFARPTVSYTVEEESSSDTEEIPDESTPLNPPESSEPSGGEEIPDESTPLNPPEEDIPDESTPLAPPTGENSGSPVWIVVGMAMAGCCAAALVMCRKKETEKVRK